MYCTGRSCLSELLDHFTEIFDNYNQGHDTDAFDKVDHEILLKKVYNLGMNKRHKAKLLPSAALPMTLE